MSMTHGYNQPDDEPDERDAEINRLTTENAEWQAKYTKLTNECDDETDAIEADRDRLTAENAGLREAARAYLDAEWVLRDEPDRHKFRLDAALAEDALRAALAEVSNIESSGILALIKP